MKEDNFTYEHLKKFKYIDCVQKEVTRIFGPLNMTMFRYVIKDHLFRGIPIYRGTNMHHQAIPIHFSSEHYKDPWEFKPDRWLNECSSMPPFTLVGFGGGARTCIGKNLATLQAKIGLIKFLKRYEKIELTTKEIELVMRLTYQPKSYTSRLTRAARE